jgi:UDP-N-acetylglucosamine:LPS N-acetylglucosamine transferase
VGGRPSKKGGNPGAGKGPNAILSFVPSRILVVSASMGAGHDGAARELVRRLRADGHEAEMRDFLNSVPWGIGAFLKSSYEFQMRYIAWSYDLTYRICYLMPRLCRPIGRTMARLTGPRLLRWAEEYQAEVIVSTYPLTSVVLGELRQGGKLALPTINFITDFGVHPLWTHRGIDLNLAVHSRPAALAQAKSGRPAIATGPMVSPRFVPLVDRAGARERLGLAADDRAVLIVAGSWGVGDVATTFRTIAASDGFVPVVVCGRDERLRERLSHIPGGRVLGWTDDMPALMAAADALVENAGGLTAMEALSVGLPIVSFHPIAGHGKENTAEMQAAGVSRVARNARELLVLLDQVTVAGPIRTTIVDAGKAMFALDPTRFVTHAARVGTAGLRDRDALAGVAAGLDESDTDQLAGVASGIDFDPAAELRALMAGAETGGPDEDDGDGGGELAPIIPIGAARSPASNHASRAHAQAPEDTAGPHDSGCDDNDVTDDPYDYDDHDDAAPAIAEKRRRRPRRPSVAVARVAALVAAVPLIWAGLTSGVGVATAYGAGVAHPRSNSGNVAYFGVRLDEAQLTNQAIVARLVALHATAVVDEQTAGQDPTDVQRLVGMGIDVENGGAGTRVNSAGHRIAQSPWTRAAGDVAASQYLARIAGQPVRVFVPGRRLNAFDLMACRGAHNKTVVPDSILEPADDEALQHLTARHTYLINGSKATAAQMLSMLDQVSTLLTSANLAGAPLADLA